MVVLDLPGSGYPMNVPLVCHDPASKLQTLLDEEEAVVETGPKP